MADNVSLSASVRTSLLSLQNTSDMISRTQNRLSTGLKVAGPTDDPVSYFQAKSLRDRSDDFSKKKDGIDQGISTLTSALDAVDGIESLVQQLKGVANSLKSASTSQFGDLITQFNSLRTQISNLATDATYQGTNLVNGTGQTLTIEFSEKTASLLTVNSVSLTESGLGVGAAATYGTGTTFEANFENDTTLTQATSITLTYNGPDHTITTGSDATFTFAYGSATLTISVNSAASGMPGGLVYSAGEVITFTVTTATIGAASAGILALSTGTTTFSSVTQGSINYVSQGDTNSINNMIRQLDSALTTLRTQAQTLGSNVALLQTRLEFTTDYVNTLVQGADKLTLADINEEGANLLALQTRQQLGINSLSFAGQAEQSILSLFR